MNNKIATKEEINFFLRRVKLIISKDDNEPEFVPRRFDFTQLGLNIAMAKKELLTLTWRDYDRGPTKDHNGDGTDIWEFGKEIDGELAYIKLKIDHNGHCKVLSFKPSRGPFTLPYKERK